HCGVVAASDENVRQRIEQGFRAIGLGMDSGMLLRSLRASLANVGRDRPMRADLECSAHAPREDSARGATGPHSGKKPFRVALTGDFHDPEGTVKYRDIGLDALVDTDMEVDFFARHLPEIAPYQLEG